MESLSTERRASSAVRMPVAMSVELAQDGTSDFFEADATNIGAGGLGIRSAMLPDIGQRMTCRFAMPDSDPCEAEGEVVWASDSGVDAGEFGIRFDTLEPAVGAALERWVSSLEGEIEAPKPSSKKNRAVRVQLDGVGSPIDGEIALRGEGVLRVEQPLPFLTLGTGAVALGERRVLRAVELRVENDVPRLVLELRTIASAEATASDEPLDDLLAPRADDSIPDPEEPSALAAEASGDEDESLPEPVPAPIVVAPRKRRDDEARAVALDVSDREVSVDSLVASAGLADPDDEPSVSERFRALAAQAKPGVLRALAAIARGWAVVVAAAGPRAASLGAAIARGLLALRERAPAALQRVVGRSPRRRTTAAPPPGREPTAARRQEARVVEPAPKPTRVPPRAVVAGVLAVIALAFVARAIASGDETDADPVPVHTVRADAPPPATEPVESEPVESAPVEPVESTPEPALAAAADEVDVASVPLPGTMPEPTTEAGRIPAPTFPAVGEGATEVISTGETVVDDDGDLTFGATDVPRGRVTTLRMSLPVVALEGESDATGFTVTLHGALSLDRAGPIAAANPAVERAAILNRGDHAVLTVRFVAGRTPAYRVEASGSSVTVTIGR